MADREYRTGEFFRNQKKYSDAISCYQAAGKIFPEHSLALEKMAYCLIEVKDFAGAEKIVQRGLQVSQNSAEKHFLLGKISAEKNDFENAQKEYEAALNLEKNNPNYGYDLAVFLHKIGKLDQSKKILEKLLENYPENPIFMNYLKIVSEDLKR
ncbi:MAG: tetratricopeptide repeat protein [Candidatus Riflebacteria bacterium]|nr:tetratricopeptide repeat protein [Candidatus Riflebacteria bacterium]